MLMYLYNMVIIQKRNQVGDYDHYTIFFTLFIVTYFALNNNCVLNAGNQEAQKEVKDSRGTKKEEEIQDLDLYGEMEAFNEMIDAEISKAVLEVDEWISQRLIKHAADKIGQADFASERAGGAIVRVENASTYVHPPKIGFIPISKTHGPESILQSSHMPGDCWAFKGATASVVVKLSYDIYVTSVTLEHISKLISPTRDISSAPKDFSIRGMEGPHNEKDLLLGKYTYKIDGMPLQQFLVQVNTRKPLRYIKMQVHSNHGNPDFTCVYRLRVHGKTF